MDIKKTTNLFINFIVKRVAEIFGIIIFCSGILILLALLTYSPEDPNFIFPENTDIKNILGFHGSFISDLLFQSIGVMAYLFSITLVATGINIITSKEFFLVIENLFFTVIYTIFGTLFFTFFYSEAFTLYINGNGGFVGNYLNQTFLKSLILINEIIFYYVLIILNIFLFLVSINFHPIKFIELVKKINRMFAKKEMKNYTDKSEIINEYIPQEEIKNIIQEDLPFIKAEMKKNNIVKFKLPDLSLLRTHSSKERGNLKKNETHDPEFLEKILLDFGVSGNIKKISHGPVVTLNEFEPAAGVKVSKIINLSDDIARNTSSESARIATIPGSNTVGIELPNNIRENVYLSEILNNSDFKKKEIKLPIALGKSISGKPIVGDLSLMPHLLIAGTTGSGKSVGLNAMLLSLLFKSDPEAVRLIMIDPKILELSVYEGIPHLLTPVITDMTDASNGLRWCVAEMDRRYKLMSEMGVRGLAAFNQKVAEANAAGTPLLDPFQDDEEVPLEELPSIVVVVDEFADMIMIVGKKVEHLIARIAQKARAAGIHLILATQRPSVDVITGLIKANVPSRIAFQVSSKIDSRTILDQGGAEQLLGAGDMLYMPAGQGVPERVHGAFVGDDEVHRVVDSWKQKSEPNYLDEITSELQETGPIPGWSDLENSDSSDENDELYDEAVAFVIESRRASISAVQRKLRIGYNRAARIIEAMEMAGLVSEMSSNGSREVLIPKQQ